MEVQSQYLDLPTDEIHVWYAALDQPPPRFHTFIQTLSITERMRAEQFHFDKDRKCFIASRGILRTILAHYLSVEPTRLQFCYGKNGKPRLADMFGRPTISFNLSRSNRIALYAFTRYREIGVDIEQIHEISEMEQIAERFFSVKENISLCALPERKKREAFFNLWTRKEALMKAIGDGLSRPLDKFDVLMVPGESTRLLKIDEDSNAESRWYIQDLKLAPGFAAALAVQGNGMKLKYWQWHE